MKARKILSNLLVCAMLLGIMSMSALAVDDWSANAITISTAEELRTLAEKVNAGTTFSGVTFTLANNIDLGNEEWEPIGNKDAGNYFKGTFDGAGYEISGLSITSASTREDYVALFGATENATIKNLTVSGAVSGANVAGIVARMNGGTLYNCVNNVNVTATEKKGGGVVCMTGVTYSSTIEECVNNGNIVGHTGDKNNDCYGGIVAYISNSGNVDVIKCINNGDILSGEYCGGINGYVMGNGGNKVCIDECVNTGNITAIGGAGGIMGLITNCTTEIKNCSNSGTIASTGSVNGIAGSIQNQNVVTETGNINTGIIKNEIGSSATPVAKIGDVEYTDLQTAVNAAANGAEIDIIDNFSLTAQDANAALKPAYNRESYAGLIIPDDKAITIDLNGKIISYVDEYADCDNLMVINLGNLTISDSVGGGKITYKPVAGSSTYSKFYSTIFNCGTLTVNGGTIENTAEAETDVTNAVDNHSRLSHEYDNDCILTVNGGQLTGAYYYAIRQYTHYYEGVKNRVTINAGTIEGGIYMQHGDSWYYADPSKNRLNVDGYLTINGGNFIATSTDNFNTIKSRLANPDNNAWGLEINGGAFNDASIQLLVQRGVYYTNGVSGATTPAEATGTRNAEWLEKNGGFITGGTFSNIGSADDVTTNLASFLADGYALVKNSNGTYGVEEKKEDVINPAFGTNNGVIKLDPTDADHEVVILATIDSLNYRNVGLEVLFDGQTVNKVLDTVYDAVKAKKSEDSEPTDIKPDAFGGNGKFIFLSKVTFGISHDAKEEFSFRPFATKLDGTVIYGKTTTDTIGK